MDRVQFFVILVLLMFLTDRGSEGKSHLVMNLFESSLNENEEVTIEVKLSIESSSGASCEVKLLCPGGGAATGICQKPLDFEVVEKGRLEFESVQKLIRYVKLKANNDICVNALVIDVIVIVDQPTCFSSDCTSKRTSSTFDCKQFEQEIIVSNVLTCPEKISDLLRTKNLRIVSSPPTQPSQSHELPEYDITNDMIQASMAIVSGLVETQNRFKETNIFKTRLDISQFIRKYTELSSFISNVAPLFGVFGAIGSIVTTFLTPNPFDEITKYLDKEFNEINEKLSDIKTDIADLKLIIEAQRGVLAMTNQLRAIRFSIRNYGILVKALSGKKVCETRQLMDMLETKEFIRQYQADNVMNSLLDLYNVDFGRLPEASYLLEPYMLAYCKGNQNMKVVQFAEQLNYYAYSGLRSYFLYHGLNATTTTSNSDEIFRQFFEFENKVNSVINIMKSNESTSRGAALQKYLEKEILDKERRRCFDFMWLKNRMLPVIQWPSLCLGIDSKSPFLMVYKKKIGKMVYNERERPSICDKIDSAAAYFKAPEDVPLVEAQENGTKCQTNVKTTLIYFKYDPEPESERLKVVWKEQNSCLFEGKQIWICPGFIKIPRNWKTVFRKDNSD